MYIKNGLEYGSGSFRMIPQLPLQMTLLWNANVSQLGKYAKTKRCGGSHPTHSITYVALKYKTIILFSNKEVALTDAILRVASITLTMQCLQCDKGCWRATYLTHRFCARFATKFLLLDTRRI